MDRSIYAQLIETLNVSDDIHPAVIGFDVLFESEKNADSDTQIYSLYVSEDITFYGVAG